MLSVLITYICFALFVVMLSFRFVNWIDLIDGLSSIINIVSSLLIVFIFLPLYICLQYGALSSMDGFHGFYFLLW